MTKLAIFTGAPFFKQPIHTGCPNIGNRDRLFERITSALDTARLTNDGPLVREFENRIAEFTEVDHCIAFCNATIALESLLLASDLKGEVIVPSFTFVATVHAVLKAGLQPVFCDIDPHTHCLDSRSVERLISDRTSAIIGVHTWGEPCAIEALSQLANENELRLFYDAAHAFGCSHHQRKIGGFGKAEVFSFHATKFVNSCEGGVVTTQDRVLAERLRLMRNFGFQNYDTVVAHGTNGKMHELSAAMGLTNLDECARFTEENRTRFDLYRHGLAQLPGLRLLDLDAKGECRNWQYVVLEIDPILAPLSRDELLSVLVEENVLARRYFFPGVHRMAPYRNLPLRRDLLSETEKLCDKVLILPTGASLSLADVEMICNLIRTAFDLADSIRKHQRIQSRLVYSSCS